MSDIKAIQTEYDGHNFRSRMEARWAVFFNAGNIRYLYEVEGFCLRDGSRYLPDMYLPDFDTFVEVKRNTSDGINEIEKLSNTLIEWGGPIKRLLVLSDIPVGKSPDGGLWHFPMLYWHDDRAVWGWAYFFDWFDGESVSLGVPADIGSANWLWRSKPKTATLGPMTDFAFRPEQRKRAFAETPSLNALIKEQMAMNEKTFRAYSLARAARFEYGETPPTAAEFKKIMAEKIRQEDEGKWEPPL